MNRWSCLGIKVASLFRSQFVFDAAMSDIVAGRYIERGVIAFLLRKNISRTLIDVVADSYMCDLPLRRHIYSPLPTSAHGAGEANNRSFYTLLHCYGFVTY